jgi:hypothetical protein
MLLFNCLATQKKPLGAAIDSVWAEAGSSRFNLEIKQFYFLFFSGLAFLSQPCYQN